MAAPRAMLEQMPPEIKLNIARSLDTEYLELVPIYSGTGFNVPFYEGESPGWQGLRSFKGTCRSLTAEGYDAYREAVRDFAVSVNLFRPHAPCDLAQGSLGDLSKRIPDSILLHVSKLRITVPLHFQSQATHSHGFESLIACTMTFERIRGGLWAWWTTDYDFLIPPQDHEEASLVLQYQELHKLIASTAVVFLNNGADTRPVNLDANRLYEVLYGLHVACLEYRYRCTHPTPKFWISPAEVWDKAVNLYEALVRGS